MSLQVVNIEIDSIPSKNQPGHVYKLQIDTDTSIQELLEFLWDQRKLVDSECQVIVLCNGIVLSKDVLIGDLRKSGKPITLNVKPKFKQQEPQIKVNPTGNAHLSQKQTSQLRTGSAIVSKGSSTAVYESENTKSNIANSEATKTTVEEINKPSFQKNYPLQQQKPQESCKMLTSNLNITPKLQDQNIEFKVEFTENGHCRSFQYSSKRDMGDDIQVLSTNNVIQFTIVDRDRKIEFKVEKN